jgi:hypothetical protein
MKPEGVLPFLQKLITVHYFEPDETNSHTRNQ